MHSNALQVNFENKSILVSYKKIFINIEGFSFSFYKKSL